MLMLKRVALRGRYVRLDPVDEADRDTMRVLLDRDPEHWAIAGSNGSGEGFASWWSGMAANAVKRGWVTWMIRDGDGRAVGTSSYINLKPGDFSVEIGATFLHPDVRGTAVNPESKRLLLGHAFDAGAHRVEFSVDTRNARSQAAMSKLGAFREGVLRRNKVTWTGHVRDSVLFSVTDLDWPALRLRLEARVESLVQTVRPSAHQGATPLGHGDL